VGSNFDFSGAFLFWRGNLGSEKENGGEMRPNTDVSKMLKQRRLMAELTLLELAAKSGVSQSHLARIERGERFPSGHILRKIAKPLGVDESQLLIVAGYLSPDSSSETGEEPRIYRRLDPYVAKVLSEEPVHVQRTMVTLFIMLKQAIAESLLRKQD